MSAPADIAAFVAALGSALVAGLFFVFSIAIMKALGALPPPQGIAAMQSINVVIVNPWFLVAFFGTAVVGVVAAVAGWGGAGGAWALAGAVVYVVGSLLATMVFNVPMNNALARAAASSPEGAALWSDYLVRWTAWNHVRTVASLAATGCFIAALVRSAAAPSP